MVARLPKAQDQHISKWVNRAPEPSGIQDAEDLIPSFPVTLLGQTIEFSKYANEEKQTSLDTT
jgi:hypothetical protein